MKKTYIIVILSIFSINLESQTIQTSLTIDRKLKVELYYKFKCDGRIERIESFSLTKNEGFLVSKGNSIYHSKDGVCQLPDSGIYYLKDIFLDNLEINRIHVYSNSQIDTILVYQTYKKPANSIPPYTVYTSCGEKCDGAIREYWDDGKLRIDGKFKDGRVLKMKQYFKNGSIKYYENKTWFSHCIKVYNEERLLWKQKRILFMNFMKFWNPGQRKYAKEEY